MIRAKYAVAKLTREQTKPRDPRGVQGRCLYYQPPDFMLRDRQVEFAFEVSHREAVGFEHHKPSYRFVATLDEAASRRPLSGMALRDRRTEW